MELWGNGVGGQVVMGGWVWGCMVVGWHCGGAIGPIFSATYTLTLHHKGKMLWCSYFRSFNKLTNFSRTGNFFKKFVSNPWKIFTSLGNSVVYHF